MHMALLLLLCIPDPGPPAVELADADRFGLTLSQVQECRRFNRAAREHAQAGQINAATDADRDRWRIILADLDDRWATYDLLADALGETAAGRGEDGEWVDDSEAWRLVCLTRLRERIGLQAWGEGRIPDHVNWRSFAEIP